MKNWFIGFSILTLALIIGCSTPEVIGVQLLDDNSIDINFSDIIHPQVATVKDDSIVVFGSDGLNITNFRRFMLGELNDANFGSARSDIYLTSGIMSTSLPDFANCTVDSLVMVLPLDTLSRFGDTMAMHDISVYRLLEFPSSSPIISERKDTIYSFDSFDHDMVPLGNVSLVPSYIDSVDVYSPALDEVIRSKPQIRIRLDQMLAEEILDTTFVESDSSYQANIRGFALKSNPSSSSLIGLNFESFTSTSTNAVLAMYYTQGDTAQLIHNFGLGTFKASNFIHDYTGSQLKLALDGATDYCYAQGMAGVNTTVDLSEVMTLQGKGINYAELEFTVLPEMTNADEFVVIPNEIVALYTNDSGTQVLVEDAVLGTTQSDFESTFNGSFEEIEENGVKKIVYRMIITNHIINLLNQEISNPVIELIVRSKVETPRRAILIGNSGDSNEIKLKLVITDPQ